MNDAFSDACSLAQEENMHNYIYHTLVSSADERIFIRVMAMYNNE